MTSSISVYYDYLEVRYEEPLRHPHDLISVSSSDPEVLRVVGNVWGHIELIPVANGTVTVTVGTALTDYTQSFTVVVGTGIKGAEAPEVESDYVIWAGGTKDPNLKSVTITTTLKATSWKDDKDKDKNGKLVWIAMTKETTPTFDAKHALQTKADAKKIVSVNNNGVVTAKGPGVAYIYAVDTGSMTWKQYVVEVKQSAAKIVIGDKADATKAAKNVVVEAGSDGELFVIPSAKVAISSKNTYTAALNKAEDSTKMSVVSEVTKNTDGNLILKYTGLKANGTKAASVKINVINTQSNKKGTVTIKVINPVKSVSPSTIDSSKLTTKNGTTEVTTGIVCADGTATSTDKFKVYVSSTEPVVKGKKVTVTAVKNIKPSIEKDGSKITLKATKDDATSTYCGIYLACTDSTTNTTRIFKIGEIGTAPTPEE